MTDLFTVTAPLTLRAHDGTQTIIAACFPYQKGLLYFDLYWHLGHVDNTNHLLQGSITGEGPWKIDGYILNVLGCHGTNHELANQFHEWQIYLEDAMSDYPPAPLIQAIARKLGATI